MYPLGLQTLCTRLLGATSLCLVLSACGGGASIDEQTTAHTDVSNDATTVAPLASSAETTTMSERHAYRVLMHATFGPSQSGLQRLRELGRGPWISEQIAQPWTPLAHTVETLYLARLKVDPTAKPERWDVVNAFWREALTSEAQLRWRVAYALSQIFVVSMDLQGSANNALAHADYHDTLARHAFGDYRQLLQALATHPAMGRYLSHMGNMPADDATGRVPDENFAREVMQLFSIGLYELNADGSYKTGADGRPLPTYGADDIAGLAKVFTGWSWDCSTGKTKKCFNAKNPPELKAGVRPMVGYTVYHSTSKKEFLGTVIPAQSTSNPGASLKSALDTLAAHPNVGPFIGRQLIQRLVTSNPSPAYIAAVSAAFNDNGKGQRGDMGAVIRTILSHPEARRPGGSSGKVREPVLRLTAVARAFPLKSVSNEFKFPFNEIVDRALGQSPLRAPSVFNFYRPGYTPPGGEVAAAGMVAPELQIADETSVATYARFMRALVDVEGFGTRDEGAPDIELDFSAVKELAENPDAMLADLHARLLGDASYPDLYAETLAAVESIAIPLPKGSGSNQDAVDRALRNRFRLALLLTVVSPEFVVQH